MSFLYFVLKHIPSLNEDTINRQAMGNNSAIFITLCIQGSVFSSPLARQPLVCPGLLKKLCPFVSVEGDFLPILDP